MQSLSLQTEPEALVLSFREIRVHRKAQGLISEVHAVSEIPLPVTGPSSNVVNRKGNGQTRTARDARGAPFGVPGSVLSLPELRACDAADTIEHKEQGADDGFLRVALDVRSHQTDSLSKRRCGAACEPGACYDPP